MADLLTTLAEFARNYMSDEALKKKAFGKANPTTEEMQDVAAKMAEQYFPEEGMMTPEELADKKKQESMAAQTPATTVKPMAPAMTPEDLIQMREERAAARKPKVLDTVNKVMGR